MREAKRIRMVPRVMGIQGTLDGGFARRSMEKRMGGPLFRQLEYREFYPFSRIIPI